MDKIEVTFTVNEKKVTVKTAPDKPLLDVLREDLLLTGTKQGCRTGECGACTVLLDSKTVNSCLVFAGQMEGREVVTIEGIANGDKLHPLQEALIEEGAVQCGFCIPGIIISAKDLLDKNAEPDEKEIKEALAGNLCRCTGYSKIVKAVQSSAEKIRESADN
ncbi:MAG: (2Fe-2S)-binding protein [Candidatus Eremiobacteraeota bacterium]|nr:(2Fe-2S)-binding protein [Candidatus Eremiobacteraeota bacterium]